MSKQTIAVDVDDVLADHFKALISWSNKNIRSNIKISDYGSHYSQLWNLPFDEAEIHTLAFHNSGVFKNFEVIEGAYEALSNLHEVYDLVVVTARRNIVIDESLEWINRFYPDIFSDVHFVPVWEPGSKVTKAELCREIGANYLIDDMPAHCVSAANSGIEALLFGDYAWNKFDETLPERLTIVNNWQEVLEYFDVKAG